MASNFLRVTTINISDKLSEEYVPFVEDLMRMIVLQTVIHFMYAMRDPCTTPFFSIAYVELLLYVILGVAAYWLLFKKLVKII
jgi:hypothetical protein